MDLDSDNEPSDNDSSSADVLEHEDRWLTTLRRIKENYPQQTMFAEHAGDHIQNISNEKWEELGRDIANNTHLTHVDLSSLNDQKMSFFFRGLSRSSTIEDLELQGNYFGAEGVRCMVPFLQNANSLTYLDLSYNNILTEGFNLIFRALRDSPIETLDCRRCGIESIDIDGEHIPKYLEFLSLENNKINTDGCRGLAELLHGGDTALTNLSLQNNVIDDEGVEIMVEALRNNSSLTYLTLKGNYGISSRGQTMMLKLVNDISSIEATLRSNHTLKYLLVNGIDPEGSLDANYEIHQQINYAIAINNNYGRYYPEAAGKEKVIQTQLLSTNRAELCRLQEVDHRSVFSEIDPIHLPEVLSLIGERHGQGELYVALISSIMSLFSTMSREGCIQQEK
eukprot:scaffold30595_cov160-Skeletonema_menzelii.AAC.2